MMQRQQTKAEVYSYDEQPPAEPKTDLRLVLLGGDSAGNSYACSTILRHHQREETINPLEGNCIEQTVGGRQVSIFRTPSYWMKHLASYWIFSNGVESIRHEIQNCTSTLFPGPHAFLLVMRAGHATGKEHYLLRAITSVFGAEALEYTMVIFIHGHEWDHPRKALSDRCVQMCGERFCVLENNDENVEELFIKIETMTQMRKRRFFVQHSYENLMKASFGSWENTRLQAQQCREHKLIEEMKAEQQLKETELRKKLETLGRAEQDLRKELESSRLNESALRKDLEASRLNESALRKDLEASRLNESALRKDLEASRLSESAVRKELNKSNDRSNKLQRDVKEYKEREKQLQQKLKDLQAREELLRDRLKLEKQKKQKTEELQARERELDHRERELRFRERKLDSSLKERSQDTAEGRSEEQTAESAEAGNVKLARRNSKDWIPPYM